MNEIEIYYYAHRFLANCTKKDKTGKIYHYKLEVVTHKSNKFLVRQSHSLRYAEIIYYLSNILIERTLYNMHRNFHHNIKTEKQK